MKTLTQYIIDFATDYENVFNNRVMSINTHNNTIYFRFRINANKAHYSLDMINVFANVTYNVVTNSIKVVTENSKGSRKYNSYVKYECEQLVKMFVSESQKALDVEIREAKSQCYDRCHVELLSMIDQTNTTHKNLCYGYINQILDLYQAGASVEEMELKLIEVKKEMLSDVRLFPKVENMQETSNTQDETTNNNTYTAYNRSFSSYDEAYNYCIQSDFDPEYIEAVSAPASQNALRLDLQLFASPIDNNVSITNGIWIKGNYTVKYIVEHTKHDKDININYDNIIKFECKNLQQAHELANLYKSHDYNNISIYYTVYNANNEPIIEDYITDMSFIMSESEKRRISQIKQDNEQLIKELELHKSFVAHYKSEKVFDQFKENINNKE
ncbi:hypothetical protein [Paenibacillus naphthalenovorans]|uniref:Uncharacterized protein n=1 Tax=Paenibacillus naphthalenovorans TaxID=162209 RepID=A0A0U2WA99_9BACL|nr:hypothetical protein [Paenibacillus naphthalenovorans]ALS22282.1 hypothetical protein IJ22_19080 [Paenibacillus naphthalenovorans]